MSRQRNYSSQMTGERCIAKRPAPKDKLRPPMPEDESHKVSVRLPDPLHAKIFGRRRKRFVVHPVPDPDILLRRLDRDQRMQLLQYLAQQTVPMPRKWALIKKEKRVDLATLMILSLSSRKDCNKLRAELIGLAPVHVLKTLRNDYCKPPFLHPSMLVKLVHVTARNLNIHRPETDDYCNQGRGYRKPNTVRIIVQMVANMFLSSRKWKDIDIQAIRRRLRALIREPNARDSGVQLGIMVQAVRTLRKRLEVSNWLTAHPLILGLRVAVGLLGMVPVLGPTCAGLLPIFEEATKVWERWSKEKATEFINDIKDLCYRFKQKAKKRVERAGGDLPAFKAGYKKVEDICS